jgi:hypothetical protein
MPEDQRCEGHLKCRRIPGANVTGKLSPLKLYPAPVTLAEEIVMFDEPGFDSWAATVLV